MFWNWKNFTLSLVLLFITEHTQFHLLVLDLLTEREMNLLAELQATKETLRVTEDEVTACKREKVRFLETLTKITVNIVLSS